MEDWAVIRRLRRSEGMAIQAIAPAAEDIGEEGEEGAIQRQPTAVWRAPRGSIVDRFEPQIRALLVEFPAMPSTVIMETGQVDPG